MASGRRRCRRGAGSALEAGAAGQKALIRRQHANIWHAMSVHFSSWPRPGPSSADLYPRTKNSDLDGVVVSRYYLHDILVACRRKARGDAASGLDERLALPRLHHRPGGKRPLVADPDPAYARRPRQLAPRLPKLRLALPRLQSHPHLGHARSVLPRRGPHADSRGRIEAESFWSFPHLVCPTSLSRICRPSTSPARVRATLPHRLPQFRFVAELPSPPSRRFHAHRRLPVRPRRGPVRSRSDLVPRPGGG